MTAPVYPSDAACAGHPHPEWWDGRRDGEPADQRRTRHQAAAVVCRTCPVTEACWADRDHTEGVRAGRWGGKPILRNEEPDTTPHLPMPAVPTGPDTLPVLLTLRQRDVLACLTHGLSTAETCQRLGISEWTMRSHMKVVLRTLAARDRAHAVQLVWSGAVTVHTSREAA